MSEAGAMYRELAREARELAEKYEQKAEAADARAAAEEAAQERVDRTPKMTILAARGLYDKEPITTIRSDDSYSQWEDTVMWHELPAVKQVAYIERAEAYGSE